MPRSCSIVKVGGSLVADAVRLRAVLAGLADGRDGPAVIVPGGGPFADAVRAAQDAVAFGEALAHRLALDAMGRMAEVFSELQPSIRIARSLEETEASLAAARTSVWNPEALRGGHPDIPENWDVTSDSLALWLATHLRAERCILVKSAPCPPNADPVELVRIGLVDRAFPDFAKRYTGDIVIRSSSDECVLRRAKERLSNPLPHPEVRGEAEPRRSPPADSAHSGGLLRGPLTRAPQDEGWDGTSGQPHRLGPADAAA